MIAIAQRSHRVRAESLADRNGRNACHDSQRLDAGLVCTRRPSHGPGPPEQGLEQDQRFVALDPAVGWSDHDLPQSGIALGPNTPKGRYDQSRGHMAGRTPPCHNPIRVPILGALAGHPLTEKGAAAKAAYDETITPAANCIAFPSPLVVALTALYLGEFELQDDVIIFRSEFFNAERTIYLDGRRHPENGERTIQGHSIGEWEDDTLVVDTTLFSEHRSPYGIGIPSGTQKHVIERYTLSDDGTQLLVDIALEDPEYLAEPFSGSLALNYSPHLEMLSIECDPEVARRFIL